MLCSCALLFIPLINAVFVKSIFISILFSLFVIHYDL